MEMKASGYSRDLASQFEEMTLKKGALDEEVEGDEGHEGDEEEGEGDSCESEEDEDSEEDEESEESEEDEEESEEEECPGEEKECPELEVQGEKTGEGDINESSEEEDEDPIENSTYLPYRDKKEKEEAKKAVHTFKVVQSSKVT